MTDTFRKISEMAPIEQIDASADAVPIIDVSEPSLSSRNKKATIAQLLAQLADGAISTAKLAAAAVTGAKLADGAITNAKVASDAAITADKLSFTQTGSGAVARAIDGKLKDVLSVKDFGAVGDNSADDTAAFQACANAAVALSKTLNRPISVYVPTGEYRIAQQIVFNLDQQNQRQRGITLFGDSRNTSRLIAASGNTTGLIKLTTDGNAELFHVRDISFLSTSSANDGTNNGIALFIESTAVQNNNAPAGFQSPIGWQQGRTVVVERVHIGPYGEDLGAINTGSHGRWNKAIYVRNRWQPLFHELYIYGSQTVEVPNLHSGIHCHYCYSPEFINIQVIGYYQYGIYNYCWDQEDFRVESAFLVNQNYGFYLERLSQVNPGVPPANTDYNNDLYEPGGSIINSHMACRVENIHIERQQDVNIIGNYLYAPVTAAFGGAQANPFGLRSSIRLIHTGSLLISGNQFLSYGHYVNDSNCTVGVRMSGAAKGVRIDNCNFIHRGIGILVDADTTGGAFGDNRVLITNCNSEGQSIWGDLDKFLLDNAGIVQGNYLSVNPGKGTDDFHTYSGASGNNAAYVKIIDALRSDFATTNDGPNGRLYEEYLRGRLNTGAVANAVIKAVKWENNNELIYSVVEQTFHGRGQGGLRLLYQWKADDAIDKTPLYFSYTQASGLVEKRVEVGPPDSAGPGYRALRVVN